MKQWLAMLFDRPNMKMKKKKVLTNCASAIAKLLCTPKHAINKLSYYK